MERNNANRIKMGILALIVCLTAFFMSRALFFISGSSIGAHNVLIAIFPVALCMACVVVIVRPDLFPWRIHSAKISPKEGILILIIALLSVPLILSYLRALTHLIFFFITFAGVLTAIYLTATRDNVTGIVAFLLIEPILNYTQWFIPDFRYSHDDYISFSFICLLLIMGADAARILKKGGRFFVRTSLNKYALALVGIAFLSAANSMDQSTSFRIFFQGCIVVAVFFLVSNHIHSKKDMMLLLNAWLFSRALKTLLFLYLSSKSLGFNISELFSLRGIGISPNAPVALGGSIPIAVSLAILHLKNPKKLVYYILIIMIFMLGILFYQTRGTLIVLALGAPMMLCYRWGKRWVAGGLVAIVLVILFSGAAPNLFRRFAPLTSINGWESALSSRLDAWRAAVEMMHDHPYLGIGPGMWQRFIHIYGKPFYWTIHGEKVQIYISSAHMNYLHGGAENGVGSILIAFFIVITVSLTVISVVKRVEDEEIHTIAVGMTWMLVGLIIGGVCIMGLGRGYASVMNHWGVMAVYMALGRIARTHSVPIENQTNKGTNR